MTQPINLGSLAFTLSTLTVYGFTEPDCQGDSLGGTLVYGRDMVLGSWDNGKKFASITMFRPLEEQEQLDISQSGQDADQDHSWSCGAYMMNYRVGTDAGCHNIPNGNTATCVRLWHY